MSHPATATAAAAAITALCLNCLAELAGQQPATAHPEPAATPGATDLLRFTNSDTLHGSFLSFDNDFSILWKNPEAPDPIRFSTKKIHRVVLNGGRAQEKIKPASSITLINGDIIPGTVTSVDEQTVTVTTTHLGTLNIPRDTVSKISPTPHGGKIFYYGPLSAEEWKTILPRVKKDDKEKNAEEGAEEGAKQDAEEPDDNNKANEWKHVANAWYSGTDKYSYLARNDTLPDKCKLAFKLAWRGSRLYCNIAIHADLAPPAKQDDNQDYRHNMAASVGQSYVINLSSHSASLYACSFDAAGKALNNRIDPATSLNLSGKQEAHFEIRIDRPNKLLLLYLDGQFRVKWDLGEEYTGKGNALALCNIGYGNGGLRISDIIVSQWNGLKDSAQSMRNKQRDIIMLTNGLDRFSGTFNHIKNDTVSFKGTYDNELSIPIHEVQEIHFASNQLRKPPEEIDETSVYFYVPPYGRISGTPGRGTNNRARLINELLGEVNLDTRYVNIIDFSHQNNLLDIWDDDF